MAWRTTLKRKMRINQKHIRIFLAEFLGTFLLMIFGQGSVAQHVLSKGAMGLFWSITIGYGLAVMMGVSASIGVSGGHINPAVTLAMAIMKRVPWTTVPCYMLGQYLGSFVASACVYAVYYGPIHHYDPYLTVTGRTATAGIFTTFPQEELALWNQFVDQIAGTGLLLIGVLAITDPKNMNISKNQISFYVGLLVLLIGNSFGYNCGYAINPARDLSPRIFTAIAGWGAEVFTYKPHYVWVTLFGPHIGAILGAFIYQLLVGIHWPDEEEPQPEPRRPLYVQTAEEETNM